MRFRWFTVIIMTVLLLGGCDAFDYHPYSDEISGMTDINPKNIAIIEQLCKGKNEIKFAFLTDTQRHYDETLDAVRHINQRDDIDFVVNGGDVSDFGMVKEFLWIRDIMNRLDVPYITLIGNHDCLGSGEHTFHKVFGTSNFGFMAGNKFIMGLNTVALEYDYSEPVPDFGFIRNQLLTINEWNSTHPEQQIKQTVVLMHARPYNDVFNNNVATIFNKFVDQFPGLTPAALTFDSGELKGSKRNGLCINGHGHNYHVEDTFNNGILYHQIPNIAERVYMVFTLNENGYEYEMVSF